jgi:hypothetical protein
LIGNTIELAGPGLRPRAGIITRQQSLPGIKSFMTSIRPDDSDPIPLRQSPHGMGTLVIRFVGLLLVAVVALALAWSR